MLLNPTTARQSAAVMPTDSFSLTNNLLAAEWTELAERTGATPYVRPEWVAAWWRAFGAGKLKILTLRRQGRLVGVLPVAYRLGCVRALVNYHTPQSGLLAEDADAACSLAHRLFSGSPRRVSLAGLHVCGISINACQGAAAKAGYRVWTHPYQVSPYLRIETTWEQYQAQLSKSQAIGLHRSLRRLSRQGQVSMDIVTGGERLPEALQQAFAIESLGWKGARHTAIQSHPETVRFYTDIARWAAARGALRLFFLRLDQQPLAMLYALEDQQVCHLLKGGYNPHYRQYSPGNLLLRSVVEHCFATGLRTVEFHGDAEPYKLHWAADTHTFKRFDAFSPSFAGRLSLVAQVHTRQTAKYLLQPLRRRHYAYEHGDTES